MSVDLFFCRSVTLPCVCLPGSFMVRLAGGETQLSSLSADYVRNPEGISCSLRSALCKETIENALILITSPWPVNATQPQTTIENCPFTFHWKIICFIKLEGCDFSYGLRHSTVTFPAIDLRHLPWSVQRWLSGGFPWVGRWPGVGE